MKVSLKTLFDQAINTDGYSQAIDLQMISGFSLQAISSGTLSASLHIHVCNEQKPVNWIVLDTQVTDGEPSNFLWNSSTGCYRWIRLFVEYGGGSGNLNALINFKGRR